MAVLAEGIISVGCQHGCHTENARTAQRVAEERLPKYENSLRSCAFNRNTSDLVVRPPRFTEGNEGNEEQASSSLPSFAFCDEEGFHPFVLAWDTERATR